MNLQPNIGTNGRIFRAIIATGLLLAAILLPSVPGFGRVLLGVSSAFVFFEALRGWCVLRACGIRTKL